MEAVPRYPCALSWNLLIWTDMPFGDNILHAFGCKNALSSFILSRPWRKTNLRDHIGTLGDPIGTPGPYGDPIGTLGPLGNPMGTPCPHGKPMGTVWFGSLGWFCSGWLFVVVWFGVALLWWSLGGLVFSLQAKRGRQWGHIYGQTRPLVYNVVLWTRYTHHKCRVAFLHGFTLAWTLTCALFVCFTLYFDCFFVVLTSETKKNSQIEKKQLTIVHFYTSPECTS